MGELTRPLLPARPARREGRRHLPHNPGGKGQRAGGSRGRQSRKCAGVRTGNARFGEELEIHYVLALFVEIPVHVVEAEWIRCFRAHLMCATPGVPAVPHVRRERIAHTTSIVPSRLGAVFRNERKCCSRVPPVGSLPRPFCPARGHNSADITFDRTLETVRGRIDHIPTLTAGFADRDTAEDAIRQILEDQIGRLGGTFERLCDALYESVPASRRAPKSANILQRVDDASDWWRRSAGTGYESWLSQPELVRLRILYQRRHLLVHRQGIVDQAYLDRSGDSAYGLSQRIVVRAQDVSELATGLRVVLHAVQPPSP